MAEELLSLKWNNHQAHFVDILTLLREKDMFIDATIACGGKVYSAHKFVLSTCSDYFKQIFTRSPTSNPIVFMKDVSCRDIEALLDFMYNGEVSVPQSSLGSLIKTAEGLQIKGLAVPDDPPSSRRQQERDKRERDPSLSFPENRSPPPKRRVREKNTPPRRLSNHQQSRPSNSTIDSSSLENNLQINNDLSDNNSSGLVRNNSPGAGPESSAPSDNNTSKKQHNNVNANSRKHSIAEEEGDEDRGGGGGEDSNHDEDSADNGSLQQPQHDGDIGTAAVTHSKHEEMEIKQEDVVDLGEDDEGGEWGDGGGMGDGGADDGGVGGNDSLSSADNTVNFSDVLLAHSEGGAMAGGSGAAGDSAMAGGRPEAVALGPSTPATFFEDFTASAGGGGGGHHHAVELSALGSVYQSLFAMSGANLRGVSGLPVSSIDAKLMSPTRGGGGEGVMGFSGLLPLGLLDDTEERPFPCPFCEARFKKKQHLQNHERIHTGEKYMCPICCQGFSRRHILKHHIFRKHLQAAGSPKGYSGTSGGGGGGGGGGSCSSTGSKSVSTTPTTPTTPSTPVSPTSLSLLPLLQSSLQHSPVVPPPPPRSVNHDVTPKKSKASGDAAVETPQSPSCSSNANSFLSNSNSFLTDPLPESVISSLLSGASLTEHPF